MMITKDACITLLHDKFVSDFSQINNVSKLTKDSRGNYKPECLTYFDNSLKTIEQNYLI